jgi:hypothetical protein
MDVSKNEATAANSVPTGALNAKVELFLASMQNVLNVSHSIQARIFHMRKTTGPPPLSVPGNTVCRLVVAMYCPMPLPMALGIGGG